MNSEGGHKVICGCSHFVDGLCNLGLNTYQFDVGSVAQIHRAFTPMYHPAEILKCDDYQKASHAHEFAIPMCRGQRFISTDPIVSTVTI